MTAKLGLPASKKLWRTAVLVDFPDGKRWSRSVLLDLRAAKKLAADFELDGHQVRVEEDANALTAHLEELAQARKGKRKASP